MEGLIAILKLLLVLRLKLVFSYLFYARLYPFLFLIWIVSSVLSRIKLFTNLFSILTWQYYIYSKAILMIYAYAVLLRCALYLLSFNFSGGWRGLSKIFFTSLKARVLLDTSVRAVLKARVLLDTSVRAVLKARVLLDTSVRAVLKIGFIAALGFAAINLLFVYWYLSTCLSFEQTFFAAFSAFKTNLAEALEVSLYEWVRFYENFVFFNEEQYSEKPTGGLFVLFNFFWPLIDYYLNAANVLQHLNEILFLPLSELSTSLSIYLYYQHLGDAGMVVSNMQEQALLFRPSPFYVLDYSSVWTFGVYFKFWWFLVNLVLEFKDSYILDWACLYEDVVYVLVLAGKESSAFVVFLWLCSYLTYLSGNLQVFYIGVELFITVGGYLMATIFGAFFFFLNYILIFLWKILLLILLHLALGVQFFLFVYPVTLCSEVLFWLWFFSAQFLVYLDSALVGSVFFFLSVFRFSLASLFYIFTLPFSLLLFILKLFFTLVTGTLGGFFAIFDCLAYFFCVSSWLLVTILFYPLFLFFSLLQINFLVLLSSWVSLFEYMYIFFNSELFVFTFSVDSFFWFSAVLYFFLAGLTAFLLAYSKTLFYSYINRTAGSNFIPSFFYNKLGYNTNKFFSLTEYERTHILDILVGFVYHNLKTLDYLYFLSGVRSTPLNQKLYLGNNVFVKASTNTVLDFCYSTYIKFAYLVILVERRVLFLFKMKFTSASLDGFSKITSFSTLTYVFVTGIRNEFNALLAVALSSAVEFVNTRYDGYRNNSWLEVPSFSFFFMFPWLSATVSYELLYWVKSSDIWYLQSKWLRYTASDEQSPLLNMARYSFNSRVLGEFVTPHLSFPTEQTNMHTLVHKYLKLAELNDVSSLRVGRRYYWETVDRDFFFRVAHARSVQFGQFCAWVYIWILDSVFPAETNFEMGGTVLYTKRMSIPHTDEAWYKRFPWMESIRLSVRSFLLGIALPVVGNLTPVFDIALIYGGDALRKAISMDAGFSLEVLAWSSQATRRKMASSDLRYDILPQMMVHPGVVLRKFLRQYTFWWGYSQIFPERMGGSLGRFIHQPKDIPNFLRVFEEVPSFVPAYSEFSEQPSTFFAPFNLEKKKMSIYLPVKLPYHPLMTVPTVEYWRKKDYLRVGHASRDYISSSLLFAYSNDMSAYYLYRRLNSFLSQAQIDSAGFCDELNFSNWDFTKPLYKVMYSELSYKYLAQRQSFVFAVSEYERFQLNRKLAARPLLIKGDEDETFWRKKYGVQELDAWNFQLAVFLDSAKQIMNNEFRVFLDGKIFQSTIPATKIFFEANYSEIGSLFADLIKTPVTSELVLWLDFIFRFLMYKITSLYVLFYNAQLPLLTHESLILWSAMQRDWYFQRMSLVNPFDLEYYVALNEMKLRLFVFEFNLWVESGIDTMELGSLVLITDSVEIID